MDPSQLPGGMGGTGGPSPQQVPEGDGSQPVVDGQAKAQRRGVLILLVALLVVAVGYVLGMLRVGNATEARNEAQLQQAQAQGAVNRLSEVPKTQAQVAELKKSLESVLGNEVLFSKLTGQTFAALPPGTVTKSLTWTLSVDKAAASTSAAAGAGTSHTLGSMAIDGTTPAFVTSAAVIEGLQRVPQLTDVWIANVSGGSTPAEGGGSSYSISASANIAPSAASGRYATGGSSK